MKKFTFLLSAFLCLGLGSLKAQVSDLFDFNDTTGANSWGSLILSGNVLYGTTAYGGINGEGNIFSINRDGSGFKNLWNFDGGGDTNGTDPGIALTLSGHKLYGVTLYGGINSNGNIYSIDTNGKGYKDLWDFDGGGDTNGSSGQCTLVLLGNKLYGMSISGGINGDGNIFCIDTNGAHYKDLWDFDNGGDTNGNRPFGSLTLASSGKALYGMTSEGGINGDGNVFSIDTNGAHYKDLFDFNGNNGSNPNSDVTQSGKMLYGMTQQGGGNYNNGVIFSMDTTGHHFKDLLLFNGLNGIAPYGSLRLSGNLLYGMTQFGGKYGSNGGGPGSGDGLIFSIDTNGKDYTDIFDFNVTDGANPGSNLTLAGGTLYGMSPNGGFYGYGNIFSDDICNLLSSSSNSTATEDTGACNGIASATSAGGPTPYMYSWSDKQTTGTATGLCAETYTCTITDNNGCTTTTSTIVSAIATGINEVKGESEEVKVYPNPSNGVFIVSCHSEQSEESLSQIEIYNVLGEQVVTETLRSAQGDNVIDMSNQPNGVYLFRVMSETGNLVGQGKLIIQK